MSKEKIDVYLEGQKSAVKRYCFKRYEAMGHVKYDKPCVTISMHGISFNAACRSYFQRKPFALLYFDSKKKAIAIMPYHERAKIGYKINPSSGSFLISARKFVTEHIRKFTNGQRIRIFPLWDEKNKMFVLDLGKKG